MRLFEFKLSKDDGRKDIIAAPAFARMVVDGGPGTGKTATACSRVAELIRSQNIPPPSILVISFTRIAVREIAERITRDIGEAVSVRIITLDSLAAFLSPEHDGADSHDDQIRLALSGLPFSQQLSPIRHLIVDEAHDVVGIRADLVEALIAHLPPECGVTIFADDAQSIYDFADKSRTPKPSLPGRLVEAGMAQHSLTILHRTHNPALTRLFTQGRNVVLSPRLTPKARHQKLNRALLRAAPVIETLPIVIDQDDLLILFRYRADVVAASQAMCEQGVAHRLRMSGLPPAIPAWIGLTLSSHQDPTLSRSRFFGYWDQKVDGTLHATLDPQQAWDRLFKTAPLDNDVGIAKLREKLLQASPPLDLCEPDLGFTGPTLGTIHASKGREAPSVILAHPKHLRRSPSDEETRVLFVGATRAKQTLTLLTHHPATPLVLPTGRLYTSDAQNPDHFRVEMGLDDDLLPTGLAGLSCFDTVSQVQKAQAILAELSSFPIRLDLDLNHIILFNNQYIAGHSSQLHYDIDALAPLMRLTPRPRQIFILGLRTLVFHPEHYDALHSPWAQSGFIVAPIITGTCPMHFERITPIKF